MTTQTMTTGDGATLSVRVWEKPGTVAGATPRDILLVHGFPASGGTFAALAEIMLLGASDATLRLVAPDLRGYGDSDKPATGYTCDRFAADVSEVATALNLRDYLLVGHSMGGKIAQIVAATKPAELDALALITPGLLAPSLSLPDLADRLAAHSDAAKTRALLSGWAAHPLDANDEEAVTADGLRVGADAWRGWLETMRGEDFAAHAARIAVPTLVIGAGKDPQRTEAELQGVVESIAGAKYARLPMSGHLPHLEDPVTLAMTLSNFLDGLPVETA
ncbi:MAG: alpha/beta hydrolase [Armatimonadetes bacterium]|nr:alpha/beta hydrolase [Armatimonadota bacterium]